MDIQREEIPAIQIKLSMHNKGVEVARAFLLIGRNDLHERPFGILEDVFVEEAHRREGRGDILVRAIIQEAKKRGCYKLIATSRFSRKSVHAWYERLGFVRHGVEFRMDLEAV